MDPGTCQPGASCQAAGGLRERVTDVLPDVHVQRGGNVRVHPCPDKSDAGAPPPPPDRGTGPGGGVCQPGAPCQAAGAGCLDGSPTSCQMCMCSAAGTYVCTPCPDKSDAGAPPPPRDGGTGTGGGVCQPGAPCQAAGAGCLDASPTSCSVCALVPARAGTYVCMPCPDVATARSPPGQRRGNLRVRAVGQSDAGAPPPPPPSDGGTMATCQTVTTPWGGTGTPCGTMENCPDGQYAVKCNGTTGQCACLKNGITTGQVSLSYAGLYGAERARHLQLPRGNVTELRENSRRDVREASPAMPPLRPTRRRLRRPRASAGSLPAPP